MRSVVAPRPGAVGLTAERQCSYRCAESTPFGSASKRERSFGEPHRNPSPGTKHRECGAASSPAFSTTLEDHLGPQLNLPCRERRNGPAKLWVPHVANRVVQIDAVKEVEGVGLELEIEPITHLDVLE